METTELINVRYKVKDSLSKFITEYRIQREGLKLASEQTMRSWIDNFLAIFNWNCKDINQVQQEKMVTKEERVRLRSIGSSHTKPDYTLKNGKVRLNFLDAKDLQDNLKDSKEIAFQARSYGWSAGLMCSIVTNIEELVFYSCLKEPSETDIADRDRKYYNYENYLDNFDEIFDLLYRENVITGKQVKVLNESITLRKTEMIDLDQSFANLLSEFRGNLAEYIYRLNPEIKESTKINTLVQSIVNKILFIRICEGRGLEEEHSLLDLLKVDFWQSFIGRTSTKYETDYDGPIFGDLALLNQITLNNNAFTGFIKKLYEPSPYKFDVIPVELFAEMYERFLSTEIIIENGTIKQVQKSFYVKQQGAISTPKYMVDFLLEQTFSGLNHIKSVEELLNLKILEPACGSGTFLLGILESLEKRAIELFLEDSVEVEHLNLFVNIDGVIYPTVELRRELILNCLYAIDMDYQAVEVAKMSMALKLIDNHSLPNYNSELGLNRSYLLNNIGKNIIHGNTLVGFDILESFNDLSEKVELLKIIVPLDIQDEFSDVFNRNETGRNGFDYIVGNPPYVETKMYIDGLPYCREYFKLVYNMDDEKADMSIYFIEKCLKLLNTEGKLSFLCQRRFFKTNYGEKTRAFMSNNNCIETIVEFDASDIFKGRTTYIALLVVNKNSNNQQFFKYAKLEDDSLNLRHKLSVIKEEEELYSLKAVEILGENTWNFLDNGKLQALIETLTGKFSSLDSLRQSGLCDIHGGIQVLRNNVYYINDPIIRGNVVYGKNRRRDKGAITDVKVEKDICRPIIANRGLKKFQEIKPTYYAIVPYTIEDTRPITFDELENDFPLCAEYLLSQEEYIRNNNKEILEGNKWILFTRTTNLQLFSGKKILFPMTAKEIVASYTPHPVYPDNANMWGLNFKNEDDEFHLAITALMNSKLFSVLAIYYSNPQANGYRKMNKQFVLPVVIPYLKMNNNRNIIKKLMGYSKSIQKNQTDLDSSSVAGEIRAISKILNKNYVELNNYVYDLYELNSYEKSLIEECYEDYMDIK
ncbi:hypothetical protein C0R09_01355 [Brevibacillus laterosporus]|uniref:Eco57I restriction-modification methylase domain-containing protein n=1 Tax=Brevibacillus laterosporus TaxID=1465 RepID=UPI000C75D9B6|nr:N-6 DNA methylase [Brevibacillus laterosporus]AUM63305.1 hypothetical protein C0R09_01355 [Brevibacillus laterosporus]